MATSQGIRNTHFVNAVDATATGDTVMTFAQPIDILRWGFITEVPLDVGAGMTVSLDHRPTAGTDTGRVEIDAMAAFTADIAAGLGRWADLDDAVAQATAVDGSLVDVGTGNPFQVDPGEQVVFDVDDAADTAGTLTIFIEYLEKPMTGTRWTTTMTEV